LNKNGKLPQKKIAAVWGPAARAADTRIDLLQKWIDPNGVVTAKALQRMTIERVRDIISRSTVKVNALTELREALTWMVVRDIDRSPSLLDSIVASVGRQADEIQTVDGNSLASLVNDSGTVTRITNIKETIAKITRLDQTLSNVARKEGTSQAWSGAQITDLQVNIQRLDDEILERVAQLALNEGSSDVLPLRVWRELSKDRGSEIVADAKAIEDLFNDLRSISRPVTVTRENVQTVDSLGNILPTKQVEEVQDLAEVVIDALKANGIENQSITYKQIEETLTGYFDLFSVDDASDVLAFGAKVGTARKEIFDLQAAREILQEGSQHKGSES
jgi:hypothetical protein